MTLKVKFELVQLGQKQKVNLEVGVNFFILLDL
jgi:hypothetical protein